jgi:nitroreductase
VISTPTTARWSVEDCSLAAQNLMLAAADRGLGSCWIGFAQGWLNTNEGRECLGLPASSCVVAPIIVGYPRSEAPTVSRKVPIVTWIGVLPPDEAGPRNSSTPALSHP